MAGYDPRMSTLSRHRPWRIEPLGDRCLVVEFEQKVDAAVNRRARALAEPGGEAVAAKARADHGIEHN